MLRTAKLCMSIATEYVWAKFSVNEQSDLTKWGMDQRSQGWHTTALNNSSLLGQWMHLSSRPPAAEWKGQKSVCHGVTLPFPESSTWNHSSLISRSGQGRHCESVKFRLTPVSLSGPSSSVHPVSRFKGKQCFISASLEIWLHIWFCSYNQHASTALLLSWEFQFRPKNPYIHQRMPWQSN